MIVRAMYGLTVCSYEKKPSSRQIDSGCGPWRFQAFVDEGNEKCEERTENGIGGNLENEVRIEIVEDQSALASRHGLESTEILSF